MTVLSLDLHSNIGGSYQLPEGRYLFRGVMHRLTDYTNNIYRQYQVYCKIDILASLPIYGKETRWSFFTFNFVVMFNGNPEVLHRSFSCFFDMIKCIHFLNLGNKDALYRIGNLYYEKILHLIHVIYIH